jgi:hypothetical protein
MGYNISCAGYARLADGRLLVAGGNKNAALDGIVQTYICRLAHRPRAADLTLRLRVGMPQSRLWAMEHFAG